jgi:hypothetical protein
MAQYRLDRLSCDWRGFTPMSALVWTEGELSTLKLLMTVGWLLASVVLHFGVRALLGRLRE